jgi:hypothetical protein
MRAAFGQLYERLRTLGYPKAGIDWMQRHRLSVVVALAVACWVFLLGCIMGAAWLYQALAGNP